MAERFAKTGVLVAAAEEIAAGHFVTAFADARMGRAAEPGQFFQVRLEGTHEPFLPRPLSIFDWLHDGTGEIAGFKVLYKVVGKGTRGLAALAQGDTAAVTGPLGNSFTMPEPGARVLVVAGGIGIAPFLAFARRCIESGISPSDIELVYGARTRPLLVAADRFAGLGVGVRLCSDDGSAGRKGTVVDLLADCLAGARRVARIYASGPTPMLNAVARFCGSRGLEGELSLEARMICGIGVCNSCAIRAVSQKDPDGWEYKLVCRDGPVFSADALYLG